MSVLVFYVNGRKVIEKEPDPEFTLLRYLREKLHLCGTKLGCGEGGCGACTVMLSKYDRKIKIVRHFSVNACLMPICSLHGLAVTTVEGIGSTRTRLHPVQERIAKAHGSQCGYCTPGMIMSMYALLRSQGTSKLTMKDLEIAFQGNLCRCTGYRPIIEGYRTFTEEYTTECAMGKKCCRNTENDCGVEIERVLFEPSQFVPLDPSQEPIFPSELKLSDAYDYETLIFTNERGVSWFRPTTFLQLLHFKKDHPMAKVVVGNTEVGIEMNLKHFDYKYLVNPSHIDELSNITVTDDGLKVGSSVTLVDLQDALQHQIDEQPDHKTRLYRSIVDMLHWFAGKQIRNVACIGGNIMTSSPISDLNPIFIAAGIQLEVESLDCGRRTVIMDESFFTGYRKNVIKDTEVLKSIFIPCTTRDQYFLAFKQAKRREDDIAIVNAAVNVKFNEGSNIIDDMKLAFGGMGPTVLLTPKTSAAVKGKLWDELLIETVNKNLIDELPLSDDAVGGMILYRRSLTLSLFFKAYLSISQGLEKRLGLHLLKDRDKSGSEVFHTLTPKSSQLFEKVSSSQPSSDPIYRPEIHSSALKQTSGEAVYVDDIPKQEDELYLALVLSTKPHAKIVSIDASEALSMPGVHVFYSAKDLTPDQNRFGAFVLDEEVFISKTVTSQGQTLGAIVADNQMIAQRAARMVKVIYEDILPVIVTIDDAIKHKSFFAGSPITLEKGNVEKAFENAVHTVTGQVQLGGQEHFYLETQAAIAIPKDSDEIELFSATQQPSELQRSVSLLLGIPSNRVVVRAKRLGGGFGGKDTRSPLVALPVAFAAHKLRRPVRLMLNRDEDMMSTGGRNPFKFNYRVAFASDGTITGYDIQVFCNAGYSVDYSEYVTLKASYGITNSYGIPNIRVETTLLKTNLPSNTAFRGFGSPQGMLVAEHMIRDVARVLGKDYLEIMAVNMCKSGYITHYDHRLEDCEIIRCFTEVQRNSEILRRRKEIAKFNDQNRWRKRGISLTNVMHVIGFEHKTKNQGGALVHIYMDGSVLISHGGVEMGQGLHIKMLQIAASALKIPIEKVHIQETATDKVPNATITGASMSTDLYGGAVLNACNILNDRLAPYRSKYPKDNYHKWINEAYNDRVSLSTTGFFVTEKIGPEYGQMFSYCTHGSAVSEVEIDCLTGDHQVLRTDIVMDIGSSLNPAIDIGQIEGAFTQGYGLLTLEDVIYSPDGTLYSRGPGMYKIPAFGDIPAEFNVSLLTGAPNPRAVYSSKAVGEPPLFLASSIFFGIKDAIAAARKEENLDPHFYLQSPATSARIRMACQDAITRNFTEAEEGTFKPWNVVP